MRKTAAIIFFTIIYCVLSSARSQTQEPATESTSAQSPSTGARQAAPATGTGATQGSPQASAPAATSSATAEELAHKYIELWNTGDKPGIDSFPDFIMHNHGGRVRVGPGMLSRVIATWRKSMPDLTFAIDDTVVQGDKAVVRVTLKGTYKERLFPESGEPSSPPRLIRATGIFIFKVADGKLQEIWQELDEDMLRVEMGAQWKTRRELAEEGAGSKSKKEDEAPTSAPPKP